MTASRSPRNLLVVALRSEHGGGPYSCPWNPSLRPGRGCLLQIKTYAPSDAVVFNIRPSCRSAGQLRRFLGVWHWESDVRVGW